MDSNRFARDEELYASVLHHLDQNCAGITSASCLALAVTAVMHTMHSAVSDFSESWNKRSKSLLPALPNEVLVACFERMHLRDRWTASRVSRGWRALLLGTPALWTCIILPSQVWDRQAAFWLQNMLQRSGNALLDVTWDADSVTDIADEYLKKSIIDLLIPRIQRMRSLAIWADDTDILLNAPAPCLETLTISRNVAQIPAEWIRSNAPMMSSLFMHWFHLPLELLPLPNIVAFKGEIPSGDAPCGQALFHLFPNLESLVLMNFHNSAQLPERAPTTLNRIVLRTCHNVDFGGVLLNWTHYPKHTGRRFEFMSNGSVDIRAALQHLAMVQPSSTANISVRCDGGSLDISTPEKYDIYWHLNRTQRRSRINGSWARLAGSPCTAAIRALSVADSMLRAVLPLEFPGLTDMTILVDADYSQTQMRLAITDGPPALRAPQLRTLAFEISQRSRSLGSMRDHTVTHLAEFVAECLCHGSGKLESVTIVQWRRPAWEAVSGLLAASDKLCYRSGMSLGDESEELGPPHEAKEPCEEWDEGTLNDLATFLTDIAM